MNLEHLEHVIVTAIGNAAVDVEVEARRRLDHHMLDTVYQARLTLTTQHTVSSSLDADVREHATQQLAFDLYNEVFGDLFKQLRVLHHEIIAAPMDVPVKARLDSLCQPILDQLRI